MSIIEKCCRAACNILYEEPGSCACGGGSNCEYWQSELVKVRAVLSALLEPDEGLMNVESPLGPMDRRGHWRAMIRHILNTRVSDGNPGGAETEGLRAAGMTARPEGGRPSSPRSSLTQTGGEG